MSRIDAVCRRLIQLMAITAGLLLGYIVVGRFDELQAHFNRMALIYLLPVGGFALLTAIIGWMRRPIHALALTLLLSLLLPLYLFEGWLIIQYEQLETKVSQAAQRFGYAYDDRTINQVVADEQKRLASERVHPFFRLVTALEQEQWLILGNTPNHRIVYCNEVGPYMIFDTDRHGFHNPDGLWQRGAPELMLIGDSYTQGACIPDGRDLASHIRRTIPHTINLGMGGNDPLLNLASLIEYAVPMRPKRVLWLHFAGNDLSGMMGNRSHPILQRYVNDGHFSQQLIQRSGEIEQRMSRFYREQLAVQSAEP
ncbi:MAG: SGNH/GDSL hydrolase family protein, partial [Magnetococcales bacterium]|nr:SGNH/GDSL hydrolase family protein [Magnetococcales bacterium]